MHILVAAFQRGLHFILLAACSGKPKFIPYLRSEVRFPPASNSGRKEKIGGRKEAIGVEAGDRKHRGSRWGGWEERGNTAAAGRPAQAQRTDSLPCAVSGKEALHPLNSPGQCLTISAVSRGLLARNKLVLASALSPPSVL